MRGRLRQPRRPHHVDEGHRDPQNLPAHLQLLPQAPGDAEGIHQRQAPERHDAHRAQPPLCRRRGFLHGLRRRHRAPHDACCDRLPIRQGKRRHRQLHRLLHRLRVHLSLQPLPRPVDQLALRERPRRRDGRPRPLGPDGLGRQEALGRRRRRRDARHRLPITLPHARLGHEHQGAHPRHTGLLEHRRPVFDGHLQGAEHQVLRPRQGHPGQDRTPQGNRADCDDAPEHVRRADLLRHVEPLLQVHHGGQRVRRPGGHQRLHHLPARARRGRQPRYEPVQARRGHAHVPRAHLRSAQGHQARRAPQPPGQSRAEGRLV